MDNKEISIKKIKPEMTQCRIIQLEKERKEKERKEKEEKEQKEKALKEKETENGKKHEQ
ncbi:hypothetical protein [Anaerocolumna sp. MB42-C2]|uniref:hypothetical protein n=1 Tax=Anaerocolumna sp. MB42-C2 TaxID=3070997 RepID=UPI0027E07903|nr:hypothetical protein [Anaerocolumna sp. MB42-C2]WMJ86442.1 hypothetical protein RBU59_20735 [Anaerocolumna sp. MB42-C2]